MDTIGDKVRKVLKSIFLIDTRDRTRNTNDADPEDCTFVNERDTLELDTNKFFRSEKGKKIISDFRNSSIPKQIER